MALGGVLAEPASFILAWLCVAVIGEMFALILFGFIRAIHARRKLELEFGELAKSVRRPPVFTLRFDLDWLRGVLERTVISIGLMAGYPHVLTFFGALKIATGLSQRNQDKSAPGHVWSMNYFLTGNLVSALLAIFYVLTAFEVQPLILSAILV